MGMVTTGRERGLWDGSCANSLKTAVRWAVLFGISAGLAVCPAVAFAQATSDDLDLLRQRAEKEGWTFSVRDNPAAHRPLEQLCGLKVPPNWRKGARWVAPPAKFVSPSRFDWRDWGGCTEVRDQRSCGSCWAFATVGAVESAILIRDGVAVDLSEQWLISCNTDEYNCTDGGWWAFDYYIDKPDPCDGVGAVLETAFPYTALEDPCGCPYPHEYVLGSWGFVGGEEDIPPVYAIKWAIMAYGPVTVGVYAGSEFAFYANGVFNVDISDEVNHAGVLVGWDDALGANGAWILRNSWDTDWGMSGYMYIAYGCSSVGLGAAVVDYGGETPGSNPVITQQPTGASIPQGFSHAFRIEAVTDNTGTLRYQWFRDGEPVTGDLSGPLYSVQRARPEDQGAYTCVVKSPTGRIVSEGAYLEVRPGTVPASCLLSWGVTACACLVIGWLRIGARRGAAVTLRQAGAGKGTAS